eukprot:2776012-Alexandrium_andersonii.AAC.1
MTWVARWRPGPSSMRLAGSCSRSAARYCSRVGRSSEPGVGRCADVGRSVSVARCRTLSTCAVYAAQ